MECKREYKFTNTWFAPHAASFAAVFPAASTNDNEFHILEIGSHEGQSTVWFVDNLLGHPASTITCIDPFLCSDTTTPVADETADLFAHNVAKSRHPDKLTHIKQLSRQALPELLAKGKSYDLIYVDGSHLAMDVMFDAVVSWYLLKENGVLWFDDFLGGDDQTRNTTAWKLPFIAITSFLRCLEPKSFQLLLQGYQLAIKKVR